jgi:hypothetical protein
MSLKMKPMDGSEYGNELSSQVNCWEFLDWLSNYWLLEKGSAPWSQ